MNLDTFWNAVGTLLGLLLFLVLKGLAAWLLLTVFYVMCVMK